MQLILKRKYRNENREKKQETSAGRQAGKQVVAYGRKETKLKGRKDLFIYKFHRYATM